MKASLRSQDRDLPTTLQAESDLKQEERLSVPGVAKSLESDDERFDERERGISMTMMSMVMDMPTRA